jgi:hypothetical protein
MNLTLTIPESTQPPITVEVGGTTELTSYVAQVAGLPDYPATFPPAIGSAGNQAVAGNDPRLTNERTPSPHTHPLADLTGLTPAAIGAMANTNAAVNAAIELDRGATLGTLDAGYVSVLDYGVVMDDTTEAVRIANAAALQTAMNAAVTAKRWLRIPSGTLHYQGEVVINGTEASPASGRCLVQGQGPSLTILKQWSTSHHGLRTRNDTSQTVYGMRLENLTLEGAGSETHDKAAFYCGRDNLGDYSSDIGLRNVDIKQYRTGCFVANCANVQFDFVSITACRINFHFYAMHTTILRNCRASQGDYHPASTCFYIEAITRGDVTVIGGEFGGSGTFRYANVLFGGIRTIGANLEGFESPQVCFTSTNGYKQLSFEGCRVAHSDLYPRTALHFWGQPAVDETVTIGATTYTWKSTVSTTANQVKIGADFRESMVNLAAAINASSVDGTGSGVRYGSSTTANASCTAVTNDSSAPYTFGHCVHVINKTSGLSAALVSCAEAMANARFVMPVGIQCLSGNFAVGETITVDGVTYTWAAAGTGVLNAYDVRIGGSRHSSIESLYCAINATSLSGWGAGDGSNASHRYGTGTLLHPHVEAYFTAQQLYFHETSPSRVSTYAMTSAAFSFIPASTQHCSFIAVKSQGSGGGSASLSIDKTGIAYGRQVESWGDSKTLLPSIVGQQVPIYQCATLGGAMTNLRTSTSGWRTWTTHTPYSNAVEAGTIALLKEDVTNVNKNAPNVWITNPILRTLNNRTNTDKWSSLNNDVLHRVLAFQDQIGTDDATEKTLFTYTLPTGWIENTTGESLELTAFGTTGNNADDKTLKLIINNVTLLTFGPYAAQAEDWFLRVTFMRGSQVRVSAELRGGTVIGSRVLHISSLGQTTNALRITGTSSTATANNIILYSAKLTWTRAVDNL